MRPEPPGCGCSPRSAAFLSLGAQRRHRIAPRCAASCRRRSDEAEGCAGRSGLPGAGNRPARPRLEHPLRTLAAERWNGRYYQLGNGGFAGNIHRPSLEAEAARGNAAAATDTGHRGDGFDARWAAGNPDAVVDYGHRSIKATSDAAAAADPRLLRPARALALFRRLLERRPPGADGGAALSGRLGRRARRRAGELWTRQLARFAALQHRLRVVPGAWLPSAKLAAIQRAALASCPAGTVADGVALESRALPFRPRGAALPRCGSRRLPDSAAARQPPAPSGARAMSRPRPPRKLGAMDRQSRPRDAVATDLRDPGLPLSARQSSRMADRGFRPRARPGVAGPGSDARRRCDRLFPLSSARRPHPFLFRLGGCGHRAAHRAELLSGGRPPRGKP